MSLRVDERPLDRITIAPSGEDPVPLEPRLRLSGQHSVSVGARAACPGGDTRSILQVTESVYMGEAGGAITVRVATDSRATSGLAVSLVVEGGQSFAPRADGGEVDCRGRLPLEGALCRGELELARAEEERDPARVLCVGDKLREMRLLAGTSGPVGGAPDPAIHARILALAEEAERCAAARAIGPDGTRIERVPVEASGPR